MGLLGLCNVRAMNSDSCLRSETLFWGGWWYPGTWAGWVGWCEGCLTVCGSGDEGCWC